MPESRCWDCGEHLPPDQLTITMIAYEGIGRNFGTRRLCATCRELGTWCAQCESAFFPSGYSGVVDQWGEMICGECCEQRGYWVCGECGEICLDESRSTCDYCEDIREEEYNPTGVRRYDNNPRICPRLAEGEDSEYAALYGVEVEMEINHNRSSWEDAARKIAGFRPSMHWLKEDGSLSDMGLELCIHPVTWDWLWKDDGNREIANLLRTAREAGGMADTRDSCGMHIHVSRNVLNRNYKVVKFSNYFVGPITRAVSERRNHYWGGHRNGYCNESKRLLTRGDRMVGSTDNRYVGVNVCNPRTIEVRLFQSTLTAWKFFKNLEYVKAAVDLATNGEEAGDPRKEILHYTYNNPQFPNLNRFYNEVL